MTTFPAEELIEMPFDGHHHGRQGQQATDIMPIVSAYCGGGIFFGNIRMDKPPLPGMSVPPPVLTGEDAVWYNAHLRERLPVEERGQFDVRTPICVTNDFTTPDTIRDARRLGCDAGKAYPAKPPEDASETVTTNSEYGVYDYRSEKMQDNWAAMEEYDVAACLHLEKHGAFCMDRETEALDDLVWLHRRFPGLRITMEHVTTAAGIACIESLGYNVRGGITPGGLFLTLDDVVGGFLKPHNFCKPVAKRREDRKAIQQAVLSGSRKFFLGTDSAPHPKDKKENENGCAGIYSAPVIIPLLRAFFGKHDRLDLLNPFVARIGPEHYGFSPYRGHLRIVRERWEVPAEMHGVVPFMHGQFLDYKVDGKVF